jgi:DNA adenine methylase
MRAAAAGGQPQGRGLCWVGRRQGHPSLDSPKGLKRKRQPPARGPGVPSTTTTDALKPFLKWPGGKRVLIRELLGVAPPHFNRYFEPFLGGGALFFALPATRAVLGDSNAELMECYLQVRDNCEAVITELRKLKNSEDDYYRVRGASPASAVAQAARFIYLVKLAFNGIYRVNRKTGHFNVPYGMRTNLQFLREDELRRASVKLKGARLLTGDFEKAVASARNGDFAFLDPPYTLAHTNNGFVRYNTQLFSWSDQVRLADCATRLADKGVAVVVTNAPHRSVIDLYPGFKRMQIHRPSQVAASASFRQSVAELVLSANV